MLVLNNEEISAIIDMPTCIAAMETAYRGMSEGRGINRRRSDTLVETGPADAGGVYSLKSMDGVSPDLGVGAVRINSDIITYPEISGQRRRLKVPAAPRRPSTHLGFVGGQRPPWQLLRNCIAGHSPAVLDVG